MNTPTVSIRSPTVYTPTGMITNGQAARIISNTSTIHPKVESATTQTDVLSEESSLFQNPAMHRFQFHHQVLHQVSVGSTYQNSLIFANLNVRDGYTQCSYSYFRKL